MPCDGHRRETRAVEVSTAGPRSVARDRRVSGDRSGGEALPDDLCRLRECVSSRFRCQDGPLDLFGESVIHGRNRFESRAILEMTHATTVTATLSKELTALRQIGPL